MWSRRVRVLSLANVSCAGANKVHHVERAQQPLRVLVKLVM